MQMGIRNAAEQLTAPRNHFAADIHAVHFAEDTGQCAGHASSAAADLEDPHLGRRAAAADLAHIGPDDFLDRLLPRGVKLRRSQSFFDEAM